MSDTISGLIDKLITINLKICYNQNLLEKYIKSVEDSWKTLQNIADLYIQREQLILETTEIFNNIISDNKLGLDINKFIQLKHKTY